MVEVARLRPFSIRFQNVCSSPPGDERLVKLEPDRFFIVCRYSPRNVFFIVFAAPFFNRFEVLATDKTEKLQTIKNALGVFNIH